MAIIDVENISKKYKISRENGNYLVLRDILHNLLLHPIQTWLKINKREKEEFWALKNISFKVEQGEVLGIIGRNGAGKSTLLKILSHITPPTSGRIKIKGKIASLLEVGTGFHPELTGRENIYVNGAILGMTKKEIEERFNKIVEFSGVEKFLDTPIKYYSSGMAMRLAFSVAAHMKSDILLIDEVLAVGDAEFQKKCLEKIDEVTTSEGRTVIFVSHNIEAVKKLCRKCLYLGRGQLLFLGETKEAISLYYSNKENNEVVYNNTTGGKIKVKYKFKDCQDDRWELDKYLVVKISWPDCDLSSGWECDLAAYTVNGFKIFAIESQKIERSRGDFSYKEINFYIKNSGLAVEEIILDVGIKERASEIYLFLLKDCARIAVGREGLPEYHRNDVLIVPEVYCEVI